MKKSYNRNAIISGGAGGIGSAIAKRLIAAGFRVVITDILPIESGNKKAKLIHRHRCRFVSCDVTSKQSVQEAMKKALAWLGQLDVSIVNAGTSINSPILKMPEADWRKIIDLNLTGSFFFAQASASHMVRNQPDPLGHRGSIIFTGTMVMRMPWPTCANYCASKAGQEMLMKVMAQELGPKGISCNSVGPGFVATGDTQKHYQHDKKFRKMVDGSVPMERLISPEELAGTYAFLASDEARYITGQSLLVEGGATLFKRQW